MIKIRVVRRLNFTHYSFHFLQIRQLPNSFDILRPLQNLHLGNCKTFLQLYPSFRLCLTFLTLYRQSYSLHLVSSQVQLDVNVVAGMRILFIPEV